MKKKLLDIGLVCVVLFAGFGIGRWLSAPVERYGIDVVDTIYENDREFMRCFVKEHYESDKYGMYDFNGSNAEQIKFTVCDYNGTELEIITVPRDWSLQPRYKQIF